MEKNSNIQGTNEWIENIEIKINSANHAHREGNKSRKRKFISAKMYTLTNS